MAAGTNKTKSSHQTARHHHRSSMKQINKPFKGAATKKSGRTISSVTASLGQAQAGSSGASGHTTMRKEDRTNKNKLMAKGKQDAIADAAKIFTGPSGAPRHVALLGNVDNLFVDIQEDLLKGGSNEDVAYSKRFKQNLLFRPINVSSSILDISDMLSTSDVLILSLNATQEPELSPELEQIFAVTRHRGISGMAIVVRSNGQNMTKQQSAACKYAWEQLIVSRIVQFTDSKSFKVFCEDGPSFHAEFIRFICQARLSPIPWRDSRGYMQILSNRLHSNGQDKILEVEGFIRGKAVLTADSFVHIPSLSSETDFLIHHIEADGKTWLPTDQKSSLPTSCDDQDKAIGLVSSDDEYEATEEQMHHDEELDGMNMIDEDSSSASSDEDEEDDELLDLYPSESAIERLRGYRGVSDLKNATWEATEDDPIPSAFSSALIRFKNYASTSKTVLKESTEGAVSTGVRVRIFLIMPINAVNISVPADSVAYVLLKHEQEKTVVTFSVNPAAVQSRPVSIASRDSYIGLFGYRRVVPVDPIFTEPPPTPQNTLHRILRKATLSLHALSDDQPSIQYCLASAVAPVQFTPCPVILFSSMGECLTYGSVLECDPARILVKRIALCARPIKIHANSCTLRGMFHNPRDVSFFAPVPIISRGDRRRIRGHIVEPIGTHGHMKCVFGEREERHADGSLASRINQRTVFAMYLYKRIYPKQR